MAQVHRRLKEEVAHGSRDREKPRAHQLDATHRKVNKHGLKRIEVSVGEPVRTIRELQELSQNQLAELTGIPQATILAIENERVNLGGVEHAKVLARALKCHPAVLLFPGWDVLLESTA